VLSRPGEGLRHSEEILEVRMSALTVAKNWHPCSAHPLRFIVEDWLRDGGINPEETQEGDEDFFRWHISVEQGISIAISLYLDGTERPYFLVEAAIARPALEGNGALERYLLERNRQVYEPYRFGLLDEGGVTVTLRGQAEGFKRDYFQKLLQNLTKFSQTAQDELKEKFGVKPFYGAEEKV
jgi:hypothetical protein